MKIAENYTGRENSLPLGKVHHGDCQRILAHMEEGSADLIVIDPPYLVNYRDRQGRSIANDVDESWLQPSFKEMYRVLADDSFCISFYGYHVVDKFMAAWKAAGFRPVGQFIWHKSYASSTGFTQFRHEAAYLLAKGKPHKPKAPLPSVMPWAYSGNKRHPTEKSVAILKPLIETYSKRGDRVLDPFCGSGSTLVAAMQTGRSAVGIELNRKFALGAQRRVNSVMEGY